MDPQHVHDYTTNETVLKSGHIEVVEVCSSCGQASRELWTSRIVRAGGKDVRVKGRLVRWTNLTLKNV